MDAIFTGPSGNGMCCLAVKHGFGYGINSATASICFYAAQFASEIKFASSNTFGEILEIQPPQRMAEHKTMFVDNDFKNYDHRQHVSVVARLHPKYATVRDVMTPEQCRAEQVEYYSLGQILDYADELADFAEHIIVIPKYDCVDQIPDRYMLGYSTPTSYGGAPGGIVELMANSKRPVHLLGGAWEQQRRLLYHSGMNIISLDFNHIHKLAMTGVFVDPLGREFRLNQAMPRFSSHPLYTCMALSLAAIRTGIDRWLIDMKCQEKASTKVS